MRLLAYALAWAASHIPHIGVATTFDVPERDRFNKPGFACQKPPRMPQAAFSARRLWDQGRIVASRTLACHTRLRVCLPRSARCALAVVGDWGPLRADIDLWRPLSELLGHNGMELAIWEIVQ